MTIRKHKMRVIATMLILAMLLVLLPTKPALAADATVSTLGALRAAISNSTGTSGAPFVIEVDNTSGPIRVLVEPINIPPGCYLKLVAKDPLFTALLREPGFTNNMITVASGAPNSLTLENIILDGNKGGGPVTAPIVYSQGTLVVGDGAVLRNNENGNNINSGGAIRVEGGSCTISGSASITGNKALYGGAITTDGGSCTISGSVSITGNTADYGGGAIYSRGTLNITGGSISNNAAVGGGGGICLVDGILTLSGGTIAGNTCGGEGNNIDFYQGAFNLSGNPQVGSVTDNGGVFLETVGGNARSITMASPLTAGARINIEGADIVLDASSLLNRVIATGASASDLSFFHNTSANSFVLNMDGTNIIFSDQQYVPPAPPPPSYDPIPQTYIVTSQPRPYTSGSGEFTISGLYLGFFNVRVNGTTLNRGVDYIASSAANGTTIVTLTEAYMKTLATGDYTLVFTYTDGSATTTLTVLHQIIAPPKTGDEATAVGFLMLTLGCVFATILMARKRNRG